MVAYYEEVDVGLDPARLSLRRSAVPTVQISLLMFKSDLDHCLTSQLQISRVQCPHCAHTHHCHLRDAMAGTENTAILPSLR